MVQIRILTAVVSIVMLGGGIVHLSMPEVFFVIVPALFPAHLVVVVSGLVEVAIGLAVLVPRFRAKAGMAFSLLCLAYMPLHLWDFIRPDPVFHPWPVAIARVLLQCCFIWTGLRLYGEGKQN